MTSSFGAKYKVIQKIGEGSFSEVLKCEDKMTGGLYAAKRLKKTFKSITDVMTCAEIIALHKLSRHPNVLYMIEYFYDPSQGKLTYVFELMDMSMYEYMKAKRRPLPESKVRNYLYQMLKGLEHLHKNGLFHRDIKPENILVKLTQAPKPGGVMYVPAEIVKLADLGSIRGIYSRAPYTEYISTRWYRSPECLLTMGYYGPKMDVWAAGCVFYEMLTLKPLFPGTNEIDQLAKIHTVLGTPSARMINKLKKKSHNCQTFPRQIGTGLVSLAGQFSADGQNVLKLMIQYDPETRINVRRLVEHRYFATLRDQYLINRFRFSALQQALGVDGIETGDHVTGYLSLAERLKQGKMSNVPPKTYNLHKTKNLSPIPSSKTSADLNSMKQLTDVSPKPYNLKKIKKSSPIANSKTSSDLYNIKHHHDAPPKIYNLYKAKKLSPIQNSKTSSDLNQSKHQASARYHNFQKSKKSPVINAKTASELGSVKQPAKLVGQKGKRASPIPNSKTSGDLNIAKMVATTATPKHLIISKPKRPLIDASKTYADVNAFGASRKRHLVRENGGPLVSLKQFKLWGVNPAMLKPRDDSKTKPPTDDEDRLRRLQRRRHWQDQHPEEIYRKTTSNLTKVFGNETGGSDPEDGIPYFQSKSFVLPRRAPARVRLGTIKENRSPNPKGRKSDAGV